MPVYVYIGEWALEIGFDSNGCFGGDFIFHQPGKKLHFVIGWVWPLPSNSDHQD